MVLTSSRRFSHRPQGLSSRISLSSSESSPLSLGDLRSLSMLLPPDITTTNLHHNYERKVNKYLTDVFYTKTLGIFSKYTFSRNHIIQGWYTRRHCCFLRNHYSLHGTIYLLTCSRILKFNYLSTTSDNIQCLECTYSW